MARLIGILMLAAALGASYTVQADESTEPAPKVAEAPMPAEAPAPMQIESSISGCLAEAEGERSDVGAARGAKAAPTGLDVTAHSWGLAVNHSLQHNCCFTAKLDATVEKSHIVINEVLSGSTCRCVCESTLLTRVQLSPGEYTIDVVVETNGKAAAPLSASASVRAVKAEPAPNQ